MEQVNVDVVDFERICTIIACESCTGLIITSDGNQHAERFVQLLEGLRCNCQLMQMDVL